jgi:tRNA 2-thiouridine synthesizing protein A
MSHAQINNTHELDVRPYACPMPIIKVSNFMKALSEGDVLKISARGDGTLKDLAALCSRTGDQMVEHIKNDKELTFYLRKT